jgi:hypothetical protein
MKLDTLLTTTLVICAVITSSVVVKREFFHSAQTAQIPGDHKAVLIRHWQDYLDKGVRMGPAQQKCDLLNSRTSSAPSAGASTRHSEPCEITFPTKSRLTTCTSRSKVIVSPYPPRESQSALANKVASKPCTTAYSMKSIFWEVSAFGGRGRSKKLLEGADRYRSE